MATGDVVADGRVDAEKLNELLELGAEQEALDFKETIDFNNAKHQVEHVKDILAMMSLVDGGYIVIGVDGHGIVSSLHPEIQAHHFDSAVLLQKVRSYVDGQVDIRSAVHERQVESGGTRKVALVYCGPPPDLMPLVVKKQGEYSVEGGKPKIVFRPGQVIVRDGTSTTTLAPQFWGRLMMRYTERVKMDARRDIDALVSRVVGYLEQTGRGGAADVPIDLGMDLNTFASAANSMIESASMSRLDQFLVPAEGELQATIAQRKFEEAVGFLDRLFVLGVAAPLYGSERQFDRFIEAVGSYYAGIPTIPDAVSNTSPSEQQRAAAWRDVVVRLYALGSLAVRRRKWAQLRVLVLRPYEVTSSYGYASWLRHGITSAARARVLDEDPAEARGAAIISRARKLIVEVPPLRPDLPIVPTDHAGQDPLLDSLAQFDILWCLVAKSAGGRPGLQDFYPSSAALDQHRVDPAFQLIVNDEHARKTLFPSVNDAHIGEVLRYVYEAAEREAWNYGGWWGELPGDVQMWLERIAP